MCVCEHSKYFIDYQYTCIHTVSSLCRCDDDINMTECAAYTTHKRIHEETEYTTVM